MKDILFNKFTTLTLIIICLWITPSGCTHKNNLFTNTALIAGTFVQVTSFNPDASQIVFASMQKQEKLFNLYQDDSQISLLNSSAGIKPVKVCYDFIRLLRISLGLYKETNGAFDPTAGRIFKFWKDEIHSANYTIDSEDIKNSIKGLLTLKGAEFFQINEDEVFISKKGIVLDLGGIAKGYLIDKAVEALKAHGVESALINAGGDIYCLGKIHNRAWKIGLKKPDTYQKILSTVDVSDKAIATSGDYEQFIDYKGKRYSHIINPKTGWPASNTLRSVTVTAPTATLADALATAFFVMGEEKTKKFLKNTSYNLNVILVSEKDGKFVTTKLTAEE